MEDLRTIRNEVLVEVSQTHETTICHGALSLYVDNSYFPESHARIYGTVVGVPKYLSTGNEKSNPPQPSFIDALVSDQGIPFAEIPQTIEKYDTVYFHRNAISPDQKLPLKDREIYRLSYDMIYFAVGNLGEIKMKGGYILAKPIETDKKEIFVLENGLWQSQDRLTLLQCIVTQEGETLRRYLFDFPIFFSHYPKCYHKPNANFKIKIDNEEHLIMRDSDIVAVQTESGELFPSFYRVFAEEVVENVVVAGNVKVIFKDENSYRRLKGIKVKITKVGMGAERIKVGSVYHTCRIDSVIQGKILVIRMVDLLCEVEGCN